MASLKDLKNRIDSVKATQKITKAMQMVAAAKLRRAQMAAESARPYAERMDAVLANISTAMDGRDDAPALMSGTGDDKVHLLVVCTAERGLCGGFNSSISRLARKHISELLSNGKTVKILCVGKKGYDALKREFGDKILDVIDHREVKRVGFENAQAIGKRVISMFDDGEFDVCTLFYSRFQTVMTQIPTAQQIIPVSLPDSEGDAAEASDAIYDYEPSEEEILADLLPRGVATQIFTALLENNASFNGAQMCAMDNATRNAGDMIDKLTIQYNRSRQAVITNELIEIISGAEAL